MLALFSTPSSWGGRWPRIPPRTSRPTDPPGPIGNHRGIRIMQSTSSRGKATPLNADSLGFATLKSSGDNQKASSASTRAGWDLGIDPQELIHTLAASLWGDHATAPNTRRFALSRLPWIIDYRFRNVTEKNLLLGRHNRQIVRLNEDYSVTVKRLPVNRFLLIDWVKHFINRSRLFRASIDHPSPHRCAGKLASLWTRTNGTWAYTDLGGDRGLLQIDLIVRGSQLPNSGDPCITPCVLRHEVVIRGPRDASHPLAVAPCLGRVHRRPSLLPAWTSPIYRACQISFISRLFSERIKRRDLRSRPDIATFVMRMSSSKPKITSSDVL